MTLRAAPHPANVLDGGNRQLPILIVILSEEESFAKRVIPRSRRTPDLSIQAEASQGILSASSGRNTFMRYRHSAALRGSFDSKTAPLRGSFSSLRMTDCGMLAQNAINQL
jgi:hypothetical protein